MVFLRVAILSALSSVVAGDHPFPKDAVCMKPTSDLCGGTHDGCAVKHGPVDCKGGACVCKEGYCSIDGYCKKECQTETLGRCPSLLGMQIGCDEGRGPTDCIDGKCICKTGYCNVFGVCTPLCQTDTEGSCAFLPCSKWRGEDVECVNGNCVCTDKENMCSVLGKCFPKSYTQGDEPFNDPDLGVPEPATLSARKDKAAPLDIPLLIMLGVPISVTCAMLAAMAFPWSPYNSARKVVPSAEQPFLSQPQ